MNVGGGRRVGGVRGHGEGCVLGIWFGSLSGAVTADSNVLLYLVKG